MQPKTHRSEIAKVRAAMGALLVLCAGLFGACQPQTEAPAPQAESSAERYALHGEVVSLDQETMTAVIDHEEIEGWMDAMTMGFSVKDRSEWEKLSVGDRIRATVVIEDVGFHLAEIDVLETTDGDEAEP